MFCGKVEAMMLPLRGSRAAVLKMTLFRYVQGLSLNWYRKLATNR